MKSEELSVKGAAGNFVEHELKEYGIEVNLTTVLRWLKKAGEECVKKNA